MENPSASNGFCPFQKAHWRRRGKKDSSNLYLALHSKKTQEKEALIDSIVQEKNITLPTDTKLYKRIIDHCVKITYEENLVLRQSYRQTAKKLMLANGFVITTKIAKNQLQPKESLRQSPDVL